MNTESQNNEQNKKNEKKKRNFTISYFLGGKVLTEEFIIKQSGLFLMIFFLIILFITNRYHCAKQLTEMDKLKSELIYLQNEEINLNSRLTKMSRQMQVEELLRKQGIELTNANPNVYQIHK